MRTENSVKNASVVIMNTILLNILRFVSRTIFIKYISSVYLGVNGLLSNILGILSLADLGIGTAIGFALYKPLAENNKETIKSIMNFYKKAYRIIALIVLIVGVALLPFLGFFINKTSTVDHLQIYYLVFLFNMIIGYLFSYMRTLIIADQKEYKITWFLIGFNFILTVLQIVVIIVFKNYLIYLLVQIFVAFIENLIINQYIKKQYPYIKENNIKPLDDENKKSLIVNIKALLFHKIGSYFVDSTDNLITSKFLGLITVGIYSNYYLITSTFSSLINTALWSTVASFGNLNVKENEEKRYEVYKSINFLGFLAHGIIAICLFQLLNIFIGEIWIGEKYLLSTATVIIICINFYVSGMMHVNDAIKSSGGLYDKDKLIPIFQSIINIAFSIILVKYYGLTGIFIGTLISSILPTIVKPFIIYKYLFKKNAINYFVEYFKQFIIILLSTIIVILINKKIIINNPYILFVVKGIISVIIPLTIIFACYHKSNEYLLLKDKLIAILGGKKKNG